MLVSWSWEWASCTIFSRAAVDRDRSKEQGISNEWVIEFGNKFKPIIDEFFKKD